MHIQRFFTALLCLLGGLTAAFNWAERIVLGRFDDIELQVAFYVAGLFGLPFFLALQYDWKRNIPRTHMIVISISLVLAFLVGFEFISNSSNDTTRTFFQTALKLGNGVLIEMLLAVLSLITIWVLRPSKNLLPFVKLRRNKK